MNETNVTLRRVHNHCQRLTGDVILLKLLLQTLIAHHPDVDALKTTFQSLVANNASQLPDAGFDRKMSADDMQQILEGMTHAEAWFLSVWPSKDR